MLDHSRLPSQSDHAGLHSHRLHLRPVEILCAARQLVEVHILEVHFHLARVDAQDLSPGGFSGMRELHLAVQTTGTKESRIQSVWPIRCSYYLLDKVIFSS